MTVDIGTYFPDRDQPPLTADEQDVVDRFHDLYYRRWLSHGADTINISWFGHQVLKCPLDLWMYQELLVRTRPDLVVETGTHHGASAHFLAMVMDHIGHGAVISVDIDGTPVRPVHPRVTYLTGSSVDPAILAEVRTRATGCRVLVILDSDHSADHVLAEMREYGPLVAVGDHMVVEDTNVNGHPTFPEFGPGPMEAIERYMAERDDFAVDPHCERFLMTLNPKGYLKRVKPPVGER
jgi:cephalosporin hydroxylase